MIEEGLLPYRAVRVRMVVGCSRPHGGGERLKSRRLVYESSAAPYVAFTIPSRYWLHPLKGCLMIKRLWSGSVVPICITLCFWWRATEARGIWGDTEG
jgi:hypothetical protein